MAFNLTRGELRSQVRDRSRAGPSLHSRNELTRSSRHYQPLSELLRSVTNTRAYIHKESGPADECLSVPSRKELIPTNQYKK